MATSTVMTHGGNPKDALVVLGRVADAFDNPSSRDSDKEFGFSVNIVKTRQPWDGQSLLSDEIDMDTSYESPFDISFDEDIELADLDVRELASSYPPVSKRSRLPKPRSYSEKIIRQIDTTHNVTKMLSSNSPLDRLDRLARMELKKTGWLERGDQWAVVEMGLQGFRTPPKTPANSKSSPRSGSVGVLSAFSTTEGMERSSPWTSTMPTPGSGYRRTPRTPRSPQWPEIGGAHSLARGDGDRGQDDRHQDCSDNGTTPTSIPSPVHSQDSPHSYRRAQELSPLSFGNSTVHTPIHMHPSMQPSAHQQTRGRLGQVVRNFVKKILPTSSGSGSPKRITRTTQTVNALHRGSRYSERESHVSTTPRSDTSAESGWTFASVSSREDPSVRPCLDYQGAKRWSGLWR